MPDKNLVEEIYEESAKKYQESVDRYGPIVKRLGDMEFAGLYAVVMAERTIRVARLIATNPLVREQAIRDLNDRVRDEGN